MIDESRMMGLREAEPTSATMIMSRELSLAADRSLWAGEHDECIAIIAQIYSLFDDLEAGIPPDLRSCLVAADTAAWVGNKQRYRTLVGGHAPALLKCRADPTGL